MSGIKYLNEGQDRPAVDFTGVQIDSSKGTFNLMEVSVRGTSSAIYGKHVLVS